MCDQCRRLFSRTTRRLTMFDDGLTEVVEFYGGPADGERARVYVGALRLTIPMPGEVALYVRARGESVARYAGPKSLAERPDD